MFRRSGLGLLAFVVGGVVLVALAGSVFGVRGGPGDRDDERETRGDAPARRAAAEAAANANATLIDDGDLVLTIGPADQSTAEAIVGELAAGDVLRIRVRAMVADRRGTVRQCVRTATGFESCTNAFPVQPGDDGVAYFQYELAEPRERCGATDACAVVVTDADGGVAYAYTVFGESARETAVVSVTPPGPYEPGDRVDVEVSGLPAGSGVDVAYCAPQCGATERAVADATGRARAPLTIRTCARGETCTIVAFGAATRDAAFAVVFSSGPNARYDLSRLLPGLAVAVILLALAGALARRTDWRPPGEAATPGLDAAQP